jgi:uncharacterized protein YjdB
MTPKFLLPALLLVLQAVPSLAQAQSGSRAALRGDVDRDGEVSAADAFSILSAAIGKVPPPQYRLMPNGDADGNGRISISDVLLVLGYSVGRESTGSPVGQPLLSVTLSADSASIEAGRSATLRATVTGATDTGIIWRSSAPDIAEVDSTGKVQARRPGTATVFAIARADTLSQAWTAIAVSPAPIAALTVSPAASVVATVGQTVQLTATAVDDQGRAVSQPLTWTSSDSTLATVDGTGKVTALRPGNATIRAAAGGKSAAKPVQVRGAAVASLSVSPATVTLAVGQKATLSATPIDAEGNALSGRTVGWSSSNPAVATVAALTSLASSGSVSAVAPGTAVITATSEGKTFRVTVTVPAPSGPAVARVTVNPTVTRLTSLGAAAQLTAKLYDSRGALLTGRAVSWTSTDTTVAVVDAAGKVTARSNGTVKVTASAEGKSASDSVVVSQAIASLALSPVSATVTVGATARITATARDAGGSIVKDTDFAWSSSNRSIATVSATGVVKGVAAGSAMVTATHGAKKASLTVRVTATAAAPADTAATETPEAPADSVAPEAPAAPATPTDSVAPAAPATPVDSVAPAAPTAPTDTVAPTAPAAPVDSVAPGAPATTEPAPVESVASSIALTPPSDSLTALGQTVQLRAVVKDGMGNVLDGQTIAWSSSNPAMASVDASGLVTAVANGNVSITAAAGPVSASAQLFVSQRATSLSISPATVHFTSLGDSISLAAVAKDATGHSLSDCSTTWLSTDPTVAIVKNTGWVVARAVGAAMVLASCGSVTDSVGVDVRQEISSVVVTPKNPSVSVGDTAHLAATAKDAGGTVVPAAFTWTSSNTAVATVDSDGDVVAKSAGNTTITASADGKSASAPLMVEAPAEVAPPSAPSGPGLAFSDGFEGGKSAAVDGYAWNGGPAVSTDVAHEGRYSLKFLYKGAPDGKDATAEQRFTFGEKLNEVWIEYYIYYPNGTEGSSARYFHRKQTIGSDNNKFLRLWGTDYNNTKVGFESRPIVRSDGTPTGDSYVYGDIAGLTMPGGPYGMDKPARRWNDAITDKERGQWVQVRVHSKIASGSGINDGVLQLWKNGTLEIDEHALRLWSDGIDGQNYFQHGYLLGWANSGYAEDTAIYIDDVKFFRSNPGW